jgi:hypothetical protein
MNMVVSEKNTATPKSYLIGGFNPLKNMIYSVGMIIHNMWKKCSKPPTSKAVVMDDRLT